MTICNLELVLRLDIYSFVWDLHDKPQDKSGRPERYFSSNYFSQKYNYSKERLLRKHNKLFNFSEPRADNVGFPVNIRLDEDVFCLHLHIFALVIRLENVLKTFSKCLQDIFKMSCQDVLKTSSTRLAKMFSINLQDCLTTSSRSFQAIFKTSYKDVFKTYSSRIIKLNCSC